MLSKHSRKLRVLKTVDPKHQLVQTARALGVSLGDQESLCLIGMEPGAMFLVHSQFRRSCCYNALWMYSAVRTAVLLPCRRQSGCLPRLCWPALALCIGLAAGGCSTQPPSPQTPDFAYVRGVDVPLLDQLGPASSSIGSLNNGDTVEVLGTRPRWTHVRTADGRTGWMRSSSLADRGLRDQFHSLTVQSSSLPSQGTALMRRDANLHLKPDRDSETFYRFAEGGEAEVLAHRVAVRSTARRAATQDDSSTEEAAASAAEVAVQTFEDWLLVRDSEARTGWMLESFADMNPPFEVAQYREGLRIRAWFVIHSEMDEGIKRPWYLWATIRRLAGLPYDFDEIRVFVWNPNRDRYETSYRERNLIGIYPIQVGSRPTPRGPSPTFTLRVEDETGKHLAKHYVMEARRVRPVSPAYWDTVHGTGETP